MSENAAYVILFIIAAPFSVLTGRWLARLLIRATTRPKPEPMRLEPARYWQLALAKSIEGLVPGGPEAVWEAAAAINGRLDSRGVVLAVDAAKRDQILADLSGPPPPDPANRQPHAPKPPRDREVS